MDPTVDADAAAAAAASALATATDTPAHDVAVVLGSGWGEAVSAFGEPVATIAMSELPGFTAPAAAGHSGTAVSVRVGQRRVLLLVGRTHAYEGHHLSRVVHPIRAVAAAGVHTVILTNAAGGINPGYRVGQTVLISDHLNLTGRSPLIGAQFVDLVDAYAPRLRDVARGVDATLADGVYAGLPGPHYETPAEIKMLATLGADLVGMSTVHETIAARAAGLDVLGVSLVTNPAAGITGESLNHAEVLAAGQDSAARIGELLHDVIAAL
ncbi:purine-nucleoside phosphorylase [Gordonia sp. TBRC 11910]|uniref:Purine nucleoside phosphorylase n=1 Tax=Gordonia asplenii TaxID=2725283 RepID=A0A848KS25_9ACTN|nr:purine-nucleoside phosphorylase [Gordonia asplenii]NMO01062.1 purine-nucleoside phosphorylase [Gordonia asplenii]